MTEVLVVIPPLGYAVPVPMQRTRGYTNLEAHRNKVIQAHDNEALFWRG